MPLRRWWASREPDDDGVSIWQTEVLAWGNLLIAVAVGVALATGYPEAPEVPWAFFILEAIVFFAGIATIYPEQVARRWARLGGSEEEDDDYSPQGLLKWWLAKRPRAQPAVVYLLFVLVVAACTWLVFDTGLGIESPFVSVAASPAVFGPFVAKEKRAVRLILVVVIFVLVVIFLAAPESSCGLDPCGEETEEARSPRPAVYLGITVTLLVIAGLISGARLEREKKLRRQNTTLRTMIGSLEADIALLREQHDGDSGTGAASRGLRPD